MLTIDTRNKLQWLNATIERLTSGNRAFTLAELEAIMAAAESGGACCIADDQRYRRQLYTAIATFEASHPVNSLH